MKVTDIRFIGLQYPLETPLQFAWGPMRRRNFALVIVETDAGISGIGESSVNFPHWALHERQATIEQGVKPLLIGEDPLRIEYLWHKLHTALHKLGILWGKGAIMSAIGAVDLALWDIAGKAYNMPVYQLLGGLLNDRIPLYATGVNAENARSFVDQGYKAVKIRLGFGAERDTQTVSAVRAAIGAAHLLVDVNMGWTLDECTRMLDVLESADVYWLEEPLLANDLDGYRALAEMTSLPLAAGENAFDPHDALALFQSEAIGYFMPDPTRAGGLTGCRKLCTLAASFGVPYSPHHFGSDVGFAAALHLLASTPGGGYMLRDISPVPLREQVLNVPLRIDAGHATVPDAPGLGISVNNEMIEKYGV